MLRGVVLVVLVLGACGFQSTLRSTDAAIDPAGDAAIDASGDPATDADVRPADASVDSGIQVILPPLCTADAGLMACYQFEGNVNDASANQLNPLPVSEVSTREEGRVGRALRVAQLSVFDVPDSPVFNVAALTIEAWVNLSQLPPPTDRAVIVDVDRQYSLFIRPNGSVGCTLVGNSPPLPETTARVTANRWFHLACTYEGGNGAIYVDGVASSTATGGATLSVAGTTGLSLAADNNATDPRTSHLVGLLDEVRLMSFARTPAQICVDAGRLDCP